MRAAGASPGQCRDPVCDEAVCCPDATSTIAGDIAGIRRSRDEEWLSVKQLPSEPLSAFASSVLHDCDISANGGAM